jgi:pimeloyl-ACP methyl ester carboxylesterase
MNTKLMVPIVALGLGLANARADHAPHCQAIDVPVTVAGAGPGAFIYGELCLPAGPAPATVQLLVHTTWHNLRSWDPPQAGYSYVRTAVASGYATFNIDRLGTGRSSTPPSNLVTITSVEDTLHQVIVALRAGNIGGHAFSHVVWVGSSFGSAYGWVNGSRHPGDIDAYVLNGIAHRTKCSFANFAGPDVVTACDDPAFAHLGLDCGYITNARGTKGALYYYEPYGAPGMTEGVDDAVLRDVVSATLLAESTLYLGGVTGFPAHSECTTLPVEGDFANGITVPTLLVMGDHDNIFCGPPDGLDCTTPEAFKAFEAPYYGVEPDVYIAPNAGHVAFLHLSGPATNAAMVSWVASKVAPN